jgi:hypothetical protein
MGRPTNSLNGKRAIDMARTAVSKIVGRFVQILRETEEACGEETSDLRDSATAGRAVRAARIFNA